MVKYMKISTNKVSSTCMYGVLDKNSRVVQCLKEQPE